MKTYAVALAKKSYTGSTAVLWTVVGVKPFLNEVQLSIDIKPSAVIAEKPHGGAVAFTATLLVIWQCEQWKEQFIPIVEAWANGDLQLRTGD